ncbi:helix-turn-helix domain-containing protein [Pseudooceanicola sp. 216_PA32_1]|uniref:Helix-turn-helix domain-containing protein n=1 Tax=Pseudooceanicola pacificus TaxID=2676438 RepID=A0A844WG47_9RHOB|nr:IclR family transcriptional regulator [Pseudooceanicola pacificus]MWB78749.1 helix-turn-helix domain-containing protein [Pseudooceanicola pacificus]
MKAPEPQKYVGAVENAVRILRRLAQADESEGVAIVARETGMNVSTAFNILKTLTKERLVTFDAQTKSYAIGLGILELAAPMLGRNPTDVIRPIMEQISADHSVLVALWTVTPTGRIVLTDRVVPTRVVHADMRQGARLPDLAGAIGRCIAAVRNPDRETLRDAYGTMRWQREPGFDAYWNDVQQARRDGFAFDFGNLFRGLSMAAVAIRDIEGAPRLGLSAISIADQIDEAGLRDAALALREAGHFIEANMFGRRD